MILAVLNLDAFQVMILNHFTYPFATSASNHFLDEMFVLFSQGLVSLGIVHEYHLLNLDLHHCSHHLTFDENLLAVVEPGEQRIPSVVSFVVPSQQLRAGLSVGEAKFPKRDHLVGIL